MCKIQQELVEHLLLQHFISDADEKSRTVFDKQEKNEHKITSFQLFGEYNA